MTLALPEEVTNAQEGEREEEPIAPPAPTPGTSLTFFSLHPLLPPANDEEKAREAADYVRKLQQIKALQNNVTFTGKVSAEVRSTRLGLASLARFRLPFLASPLS